MQQERQWKRNQIIYMTQDNEEESVQTFQFSRDTSTSVSTDTTSQNNNNIVIEESQVPENPLQAPRFVTRFPTNAFVNQNNLENIYIKLRKIRTISDSRDVQEEMKNFIKDYEPIANIFKEYPQLSQNKVDLSQYKGFKKVRGDGNCFFTAFAYSYLKLKLLKKSIPEAKQFLEEIKSFEFQQLQFYQRIKISRYDFIEEKVNLIFSDEEKKYQLPQLLHYFFDIILNERQKNEYRGQAQLDKYFKFDKENFFYEIIILYIRSKIFKQFQNSDSPFKFQVKAEEIQIWEKEVENNDVILNIISEMEQMQEYKIQINGQSNCDIDDKLQQD